jgi:hypothetical protein
MQQMKAQLSRVTAVLCLLTCHGVAVALAQADGDLTAKARLFSGIGPGLREVVAGTDGHLYVLASPSPGLVMFDRQGKQVMAISEAAAVTAGATGAPAHVAISFGEDCDVDAEGRIYIADRGMNAIQVFAPDGTALRSIPVTAPTSVAALGEGEVAVATLREPHLVIVFDKNGRDVREFGDPEQISDRQDLNRFLNIGELATDGKGHLYYGFSYTPEPTVRRYDRYGYGAGPDVQYLALEAASEAQAVRREIIQQEKKHKNPAFKRVLTAVGVDRDSGEVWMAVGNTLLHFDKEGTRRAGYKLYTPDGARLEANTLVIESDRLIVGGDPIGVYQFDRPDKKAKP